MVLYNFGKNIKFAQRNIKFLPFRFFWGGEGGTKFSRICRKLCRKFGQNFGKISCAQNFNKTATLQTANTAQETAFHPGNNDIT